MEIAHILRTLWRRKLWVLLGVPLAAVAAYAATFGLTFPPNLEGRSVEYGAASTQVLLDAGRSSLLDVEADIEGLSKRAELYSRLVESAPVQETIARHAGPNGDDVEVASRTAATGVMRAAREPAAEERANQIEGEAYRRRVLFASEPGLPVISIASQAPTAEEAIRIADAGARGLIEYVRTLETKNRVPIATRVELVQLGPARGGMVNQGASNVLAFMVFFGTFGVWCLLVLFGSSLVAALREPEMAEAVAPAGQVEEREPAGQVEERDFGARAASEGDGRRATRTARRRAGRRGR